MDGEGRGKKWGMIRRKRNASAAAQPIMPNRTTFLQIDGRRQSYVDADALAAQRIDFAGRRIDKNATEELSKVEMANLLQRCAADDERVRSGAMLPPTENAGSGAPSEAP
jgi:hypothetical protein